MLRAILAAALLGTPALADPDHAAIAERALNRHILPGFERLAATTAALAEAAEAACAGAGPIDRAPVDSAYHAAFDAWVAISHLRFGPMEEDNAGFAIAFWPDTRGATPRALSAQIAVEDPVVDDPATFREVSVAARGLFALDQLLFDPGEPAVEASGYRCRLLEAITNDLATTADTVLARWRDPWAGILTSAGNPDNPIYFTPEESTRALYSSLATGLQATVDLRLGRPLGTFERPQPRRAEAWRSGRSLRDVVVSLEATREFAEVAFLPEVDPGAAAGVRASFDAALAAGNQVGEPIPEAVVKPQGRVRVEALQQAVSRVEERLALEIGGAFGVTTGFNSMDGD
jgi:predicted lipoprotein